MENAQLLKKVPKIVACAEWAITWANIMLPEEKRRSGGYLTIREAESGQIVLILACGKISKEKNEMFLSFSQEKGFRLFKNPNHQTSWQSRNIANNEFGGALRGRSYIYSFSGHQEEIDEAICLITFYLLEPILSRNPDIRWLNRKLSSQAFEYLQYDIFERNPLAYKLLGALRDQRINPEGQHTNAFLDASLDKKYF